MTGSNTFGGTIKLEGEKAYRQAISQINSDLKVLASEMGKVTSEFSKNDKSTSSLSSKGNGHFCTNISEYIITFAPNKDFSKKKKPLIKILMNGCLINYLKRSLCVPVRTKDNISLSLKNW